MKQLLLIAAFLLSSYSYAESVRISILTKSIKKISAASSGIITLSPAKGSVITDQKTGTILNAENIRLIKSNRWSIEAGRPCDEGLFRVEGTEMMVSDNGETRRYPLPATISLEKDVPSVIVEEDIFRYAVDSAAAELGSVSRTELEAQAALSLVILARCRSGSGKTLSDLTYDQIYRGRLVSDSFSIKDDGWEIDCAKLKGELLFHAESGGRTFSQKIFAGRDGGYPGVEDMLPFWGIRLGADDRWENRLTYEELSSICKSGIAGEADFKKYYASVYPEEFRLRINRVKGWSFLRSNNFSFDGDSDGIVFSGVGLGHGCGLSQRGSLKLARFGFSRYEILQHYYSGISFRNTGAKLPYNVSFVIFDLASGQVLHSSNAALSERRIPPGSFTKILSSLAFLSSDTVAKDRIYRCAGHDTAIRFDCWNVKGHGELHLREALYNSCNLYFAHESLRISYSQYRDEMCEITKLIGIKDFLPDDADLPRYQRLVCGLDFSVNTSVSDIIKLVSFVAGFGPAGMNEERRYVREALGKTLTEGTGRKNEKEAINGDGVRAGIGDSSANGMFGKTSTVIYGSNVSVGYGMFAGWKGGRGIIVIMRKATGQMAAQWAKLLLD